MNAQEIQNIVEARYNRASWLKLLHGVFGAKVKFFAAPTTLTVEKAIASEAVYLGDVTLQDDHKIAVYEVHLSEHVNIERNRAGIRNLLCSQWRGAGFAGAFMLCYRNSESVLRFSYVSESWAFNDDGAYKKESTDALRFTYLLGEGHRSRTAVQQFMELSNSGLTLKDVTKAFSVEALSKRFFDEYKRNYEEIVEYVTGKRAVKSGSKWEMQTTHAPNRKIMAQFAVFADPDKAVRDYVKKLMGRLVFIQFLQKKGWMGVPANDSAWKNGDKDFVQNLFKNTKNKDSFIDDVLEPLFDDLNTKRENDLVSSEMVGKGIKVPYLNGGLFEKDAQDNTEFLLPQKFMEGLLEFFTQYNFTIDENDPDDAEVGVDPEMLSCIFENLLEDNKEKGAFYTPKEIVQYMCRESLIAHLCNGVKKNETKERIRDFVLTHKVDVLNGDEDISEEVDEKLKNVKICDPAIGSGAFPMGLMRELYFCRSAIEGFDYAKAAEIKKHIIQQNIYGVDIEKGAVDIARLRFWLSLIVDEETPHALPNLDFKIMQGNSLLEQYEGVDLSDITYKASKDEKKNGKWFDLFDSGLTKNKQLISFLKDKFFDCEDHETKRQIRDALKSEIQALLLEKGCGIKLDAIRDVTATDQFFLWHTWFSEVFEQGGFDIVIGNPPYISAPTQIATPQLAIQRERLAKSKKYRSLYQKWDLYIPFIELSLQLCAKGGVCDMIVPYPLTNQLYAKMLRKMIVEEYDIFELADLNGTKIFENATVSNCIPFIKKAKPQNKTWISNVNEDLVIAKSFEQSLENLVQDKKNYVWNVTQERRETNRHADMHVLGDYCYISVGMVLNADEKNAKGEFSKEDLISERKDEIHCREYIEAKDIEKYFVNRIRYLEYNTSRCPDKVRRPTFRELYNCSKLVMNCLGTINATYDQDFHFLHNHSIYCSILWIDLYGVENKSITSSIKKFSTLSRSQMENLSKEVDLRYLLGVMNSRYASVLLTNLRGGDYHIYPEHIRNIPIPSASKEQQQSVITLVDKILAAKKANPQADTTDLEKQIDQLVYKLYNLTPAEIETIEKN